MTPTTMTKQQLVAEVVRLTQELGRERQVSDRMMAQRDELTKILIDNLKAQGVLPA